MSDTEKCGSCGDECEIYEDGLCNFCFRVKLTTDFTTAFTAEDAMLNTKEQDNE